MRTLAYGLSSAVGKSRQHAVKMYTDASFNSEPETSRSFGGNFLFVDESPVAWRPKGQATVAKSTCESEYIACSDAASHLLWAIQALSDLKARLTELPVLQCDNQPAIALTSDAKINSRTKHISVHFHFVPPWIGIKFVVTYIYSKENIRRGINGQDIIVDLQR